MCSKKEEMCGEEHLNNIASENRGPFPFAAEKKQAGDA